MTKEQIISLNLGIDTDDIKEVLSVEAAVEWLAANTTINTEDLENLPSRAKLFITEFISLNSKRGISSESIQGLSQSFSSEKVTDMIWDLAESLLSDDIKGRVRFVAAQSRW